MFAHAVEYNDDIVYAVSKKRKESNDEQSIHLRTREVRIRRIEARRNDDVYREHGDNGETVSPTRDRMRDLPECPCDVEHDGKDDGKKSNESLSRKLVSERGPDGRETELMELCPAWRESGNNSVVFLRGKRTGPNDNSLLSNLAKGYFAKRNCGNALTKHRDVRTCAVTRLRGKVFNLYQGTARKVNRERQPIPPDCGYGRGKYE